MLNDSIASYKFIHLGNIKLAFTRICRDELFRDIYFAASSLYYVESGTAILHTRDEKITVASGESVLIRQHTKLDIQKFKDADGRDFRSIIFYLFPDFVLEFLQQIKGKHSSSVFSTTALIHLSEQRSLKDFCESLLPLFDKRQVENTAIQSKTFEALHLLLQHNKDFVSFLADNVKPVKIDLFEFMIHNVLSGYSVPELARLTGRSLSAFKRDFKAVFATTPHQWLLNRKLDYAEQLLREKKMTASDMYLLLGFNELSHFSAAFKKKKGFSPTQL